MTVEKPVSVALNEEHLATELRQALRQTLFSSGLRISPRRVNQIGQEVAAAFIEFLKAENGEGARTYGQRLAAEGLGPHSILAVTEALRRVCRESVDPAAAPPVAGCYVNALLEGYMAGREAFLLQEQERTQRAFQRAQARQDQ